MRDIRNKNLIWWIGIGSCTVLFVFIGIFSYMKMSFLLNGVNITAQVERQGDSPIAIISGKAPKANHVTINGREIFIEKDGSFSETMAFIPGYSVVTIDAKDKFGKSDEKKFEMIYTEPNPQVALIDETKNY